MDVAVSDLLREASRLLDARLARALGEQGVSLGEWLVLRALLRSGAVPPSALAATCGLTRGAVTKLVDRLRTKRLVVRAAAGGADRRFQTIALTGAGATLMPVLAQAVATVGATALSPSERATIRRALA